MYRAVNMHECLQEESSNFQTVGAATRKLRAPKFSLYDGTVNKL